MKERYEFSRGVVPRKTGVTRKFPRFDHVGIVLVKDSMVSRQPTEGRGATRDNTHVDSVGNVIEERVLSLDGGRDVRYGEIVDSRLSFSV